MLALSCLDGYGLREIAPGVWRPARLVTAHDGEDIQPFSSSFSALAGEQVSFREAAILIFSPLVGLRPSRSGVSLTLNFPNPGSEISSPFAAALMMLFSMLSTIPCACVLLTLCASAIFATSSDVFTSGFLKNRMGGLYRIESKRCHLNWTPINSLRHLG